MATRLLTRTKTLTRNLLHPYSSVDPIPISKSLRSLHSLFSHGIFQLSDSRSTSSRSIPKIDFAASPAISGILGSGKIGGYEKTLPRWFCVKPLGRTMMNQADKATSQLFPSAEKKILQEMGKTVSGVEGEGADEPNSYSNGKVICFSPLEGSSTKTRSSGLAKESSKIKRTELSQKITYALIPALLLVSKSSLTTSLLILSVYWQIYGFFKEIFLDYVHQEVTLKWVLIYFKVLLLILAKDTILDFGLV